MQSERAGGVALVCDPWGSVLQCPRDDLGIVPADSSRYPFGNLLDPSSLERAGSMFEEVRERAASFNHELLVRTIEGELKTLCFMAGRVAQERVLLIGAVSPGGLEQFYGELMAMNNEHTNLVRSMWRDTTRGSSGFDDVTRMNNELATAQRALVKANTALGRAVSDKNRLIGMAAHDLRNLVSAILAFSEVLLDPGGTLDEDRRRHCLRRIRRSSDQMRVMIDDMLQLTTIEAGKLELRPEKSDLGRLVKDAVATQAVLAEEKGIDLSSRIDPDLPTVSADPQRIEQVLFNVIGNAIKFSPSGHPVEVEVRRAEGGAFDGSGRLRISVHDRGPGIPKAEIPDLFKPFSRTSVRPPDGAPSTGLGLAIATRIVEAHGGRLWCESELGQGSTFHITLPVED